MFTFTGFIIQMSFFVLPKFSTFILTDLQVFQVRTVWLKRLPQSLSPCKTSLEDKENNLKLMPVDFTTRNKTSHLLQGFQTLHVWTLKTGCRSLAANLVTCSQKRQQSRCLWELPVLTKVTGTVVLHDVVCFQLIVTRRTNLWHWGDRRDSLKYFKKVVI